MTELAAEAGTTDNRPVLFLVAAEPSGDALGAPIIEAVRRLSGDGFRLAGVGGELMTRAGLDSLFPMDELTAFGLAEVLPKIPGILRRMKQTASTARLTRPAAILTIDAPDFSFRLVRKLRDLDCPKLHLVAPTVWAWRPKRAKKIAGLYDHLLCLFPFEPPYFEREGLAASFIGHPLIAGPAMQADGAAFRQRHGIASDERLIMLLPGSRRGEVERLLPIFGAALQTLQQRIGGVRLILPTVPAVAELVASGTAHWPMPVTLLHGAEDKYGGMKAADAALAASGTVALELAICDTPAVIAYRVNALSAAIFRRLTLTRYVSLPNIILQQPLVPELLQEQCEPAGLAGALAGLLDDAARRQVMLDGYARVRQALGAGGPDPAEAAAWQLIAMAGKAAAGSDQPEIAGQ